MKKLFLPIVFLFVAACSVDNEDLDVQKTPFQEFNAVVQAEDCNVSTTTHNFGSSGKIEVTNDADSLFVTITSTAENFDLVNTKLHVANSESDFPTVGKGNLPPGQMEHKVEFEPGVQSYTFTFPLSDFGQCTYIASQSAFSDGETSTTSWAGDNAVKKGNWSYFQYCIQECIPACEPIYTGPSVLSDTITYTEAKAIANYELMRDLYSGLIDPADYHGDEDALDEHTRYNPTMFLLSTEQFLKLDQSFGTYDLTTTFSYGIDGCEEYAGEIELTMTIIDDRQSE